MGGDGKMTNGDTPIVSQRSLQRLNLILVVLVVLVLGGVIAMNVYAAKAISDINRRQIAQVSHQNDLQLCAQHDMVFAIRKIGLKLGLPVSDIVPPDIRGLDCAT